MKRKSGRKSRWSAWLMAFVLAAGIGALNGPFAVQAQAVSPSGVSESVVDSASVSSDDSSVTGEETASESVLTNDSEDVQEEASGIVGTADAVSETSDESAIDVSEDAGQDNSDTDAEAAMVSAYSDAGELSGYTVDDNAKTITVPSDKSIQAAINYISGTTDKVGWTITVEDGIYSRFAVLDGLDNLVIQAANQGEATVNVLDGSTPEGVSFGGGHPNDEGIIVWNADNVTIDGFVINSTSAMSSPWYAASLSTYSESTEKADNMTVKNCTFTGSGKYGIFCCSGTRTITIDHNTFESGISEAIEFMCDGNDAGGSSIIGNTFNGNSFAIHGYWGGTPGENPSLTVSGNILNGAGSGTTDRRCKIVIEDQISQGSVKPDVSENTINNGVIGLVNISNTSAEDVISGNTMNEGSFAVDAKEPGTIDLYSNYKVYQGDYHFGYWALTNIDDDNKLDVSWGGNPGDTIKVVQAAIDEANAEHSNVLSINADMNGELIRTFTWFKDAVYWVPYDNGSLTVSKSSDSIVKSGETFTFEIQLTGDGIDGQQVFYDGNVSDGTQANPTTFTDGKAEITLSKGESLTLEGIPAGTTFTVTETGADEYNTLPAEKAISGTIVKDETATAEFTNARTRNITVRKVWDDADNQDGIRPDSVTIRLLANDKAAKDTKGQDITAVVTGGEDGSWTNSFEDLPVYDREGTEITYTITEDEVNGYTTDRQGGRRVHHHQHAYAGSDGHQGEQGMG